MQKELVVLKGTKILSFKTAVIQPSHFYRSCSIEQNQYLVYGIVFSKAKFNKLFEYAIDKVLRDFKAIGLLTEDNKPISKSLFTKLADIHTYGRGRGIKIWYFRETRDIIYGFYPMKGTKSENQKECYEYYLELVNGNDECLDSEDVCFGNCGIPLSYTKLRIY